MSTRPDPTGRRQQDRRRVLEQVRAELDHEARLLDLYEAKYSLMRRRVYLAILAIQLLILIAVAFGITFGDKQHGVLSGIVALSALMTALAVRLDRPFSHRGAKALADDLDDSTSERPEGTS